MTHIPAAPAAVDYLLLTPGPLSTTATVRAAMLQDSCTWDADYNLGVVEPIRRELVRLAHERLVNAPRIQMKGVPLQRQAGLVGPELFRAKQMLEKLGKELGIEVIAEGIETRAELDCLRQMGVELFQGYLLAKPGFESLPEVNYPA